MNHYRDFSKVVVLAFLLLAVISSGCSESGDSAAQTVTAAFNNLTETAKAAPTSTNTPIPTQPPPPPVEVTQPPSPPQAPAETVVPPSSGPTLIALEDTNCRMGADPIYPITGAFIKNMESRIIGTNENQSWWLIDDPRGEGQSCWVWGQTTRVNGDASSVPYIPSPQLPADLPLPYVPPEEPPV